MNAEPQFLVLQRAEKEKLYPGLWQIVTGTMKKNERALHAALRELKEETGLSPRRCWAVPYVDSYFDPAAEAIQVVPVFAAELDSFSTVHVSSEHQRFQWLRLKNAQQRLVWPGQRRAMEIVHEFIVENKDSARLVEITHSQIERKSL